jgi:hypothetical protein
MRCVARIDRETVGGGVYLTSYIGMSGVLERLLVVICVYIWEEQRCFALLCFALLLGSLCVAVCVRLRAHGE